MILKIFKLPILIILTYFEVRKSPVPQRYYTWLDLFKFKFKLLLKNIFSNGNNELTMYFKDLKLYSPNLQTMEYLFDEIFVSGEYYQTNLDENIKNIFDCGANIGFATIFFKIVFPNANINCFEPNPYTFHFLEKNMQINGFDHVQLHQVALSNEEGKVDLYFSEDVSVTASMDSGRSNFNKKVTVETKKLSSYLNQIKPELLKIDVEGAEHLILDDLSRTSTLNIPSTYLLEYHNYGDISLFTEFFEKFADVGFKYQLEARINKKKDFQDQLLLLWR